MKLDGGRVKAGQRQLVSQAWDRHRRDQLLISCTSRQVKEAMISEFYAEQRCGMNEAFVMEIPMLCSEAYSDTEPVVRAARVRGHTTGSTLTLGTGWDFSKRDH